VLGRRDPETGHYPQVDLTDCDPARHVSRRHVTLARDGLQYRLSVHPATNPTRLDGVLVEAGTEHWVAPGARLELGDLVLRLTTKPVLDEVPQPLAGAAS
jgi:predicted component of type VI protein secretion system